MHTICVPARICSVSEAKEMVTFSLCLHPETLAIFRRSTAARRDLTVFLEKETPFETVPGQRFGVTHDRSVQQSCALGSDFK